MYCTLRRYGTIGIFEAPDEKVSMKTAIDAFDRVASRTHTVVPIEEEVKLLE